MENIIYRYKNIITILKSADCISYIKNLAFELDLKLDLDYSETGWIFKKQTIRFKVESKSKENVQTFIDRIFSALNYYNSNLTGISGL